MKYICQLLLIILCISSGYLYANDDFEEYISNDNSIDAPEEYTTSFKESIEYILQTNKIDEIVNLLNEEPSLMHTPLYAGNNVLHLSCLYGRTKILDLAIQNKVSLTVLNKSKQTLWHIAGMSKQNTCLLYLLDQAIIKKNKTLLDSFVKLDVKKNSFIHYLLMYQLENIDLLKSVLNINQSIRGIDINALNTEGYGLVHLAKSYSKQNSILILKEYGADVSLKNKNNMSIFDY